MGPNLVTPVGFRPYASGLAWTQHSPAAQPSAPRCRQRRWLVNFPAGKYDRYGAAPHVDHYPPYPVELATATGTVSPGTVARRRMNGIEKRFRGAEVAPPGAAGLRVRL